MTEEVKAFLKRIDKALDNPDFQQIYTDLAGKYITEFRSFTNEEKTYINGKLQEAIDSKTNRINFN